jgi:hypothetical protein
MLACGGNSSVPDGRGGDAAVFDAAALCGHVVFPNADLGTCRAVSGPGCPAGQYAVVCGVYGPFAQDSPPANCTIDPPNPGGETGACCPCL